MLPLSQNIIESYLLFRMRAAGYRGPSPFTPPAASLIGKASQGLMRRVNILADKALLAAFVENTHGVEQRHVQAAIKDTELDSPNRPWWKRKETVIAGAFVLSATLIVALTLWATSAEKNNIQINQSITKEKPPVAYDDVTATPPPSITQVQSGDQEVKLLMTPTLNTTPSSPAATTTDTAPAPATGKSPAPKLSGEAQKNSPVTTQTEPSQTPLLDQRLAAARQTFANSPAGSVSIQLYYTDHVKPTRVEAFLKRANEQGTLQKIYVVPIKINGRKGYRVLFGFYSSNEQARAGMRQLPQRFREAFAPTIFPLEDLPST